VNSSVVTASKHIERKHGRGHMTLRLIVSLPFVVFIVPSSSELQLIVSLLSRQEFLSSSN
jgi:hypothetical protein